MYTVGIAALLGVVLWIFARDGNKKFFKTIPQLILIVCVFSMFGLCISWSVGDFIKTCQVSYQDTIPLYSGYTSPAISGHFFLGGGTISDKDVVYYWAVQPDGSYVQRHADVSQSKFFEENRQDGVLTIDHFECTGNNWGMTTFLGLFSVITPHDPLYEFHVPVGSIFMGYQIK